MSEDLEALAGEYVLGVLPPDEEHAFEMRLRTDAEARAWVDYWRTSFAEWSQALPPAPVPHVKDRIDEAIFGKPPFKRWERVLLHPFFVPGIVLVILAATLLKVLLIPH